MKDVFVHDEGGVQERRSRSCGVLWGAFWVVGHGKTPSANRNVTNNQDKGSFVPSTVVPGHEISCNSNTAVEIRECFRLGSGDTVDECLRSATAAEFGICIV